jgi:ribosomal protein L22
MAEPKDTEKKEPAKKPAPEKKSAAKKPAAKTEAAKKPAAKKPAAKKPAAKKPAEKKPAAKKPAAKKPAAKKPAAKPKTAPKEPAAPVAPPVVRASAKYVRIAPRKVRLIADQVRGMQIDDARALLRFSTRSAAQDVAKLLDSAAANAENNHDLVADDLKVSEITVNEGPTLKRYRPRALGRATPIHKRTSHIAVALVPEEE